MPTAKNGFQILNLHRKKDVAISKINAPFFNAYLLDKFLYFFYMQLK